jgi:HPt (histidine-containing phosphotransfer) domain-containing protein
MTKEARILLSCKTVCMKSLTLDSQMLFELYGGSYDDVTFILNDYLDKHKEIVSAFNSAFKAGIGALTRCAHRHSSSFTYIGMGQLTEECKNFEKLCTQAGDTMEVKPEFESLLRMIEEGAVLVKQELTRLKIA